jgi:hypothetical protein
MMDAMNPRLEDLPNHAGDVSMLLDVIEERPDIFGDIDTSRTLYSGFSMGAISGLFFSNSCCRDERIRGVVAVSGVLFDERFGFRFPYDFDAGPEILAIIDVNDEVIPYSYASSLIGKSNKMQVLSIDGGGHDEDLSSYCLGAMTYMNDFMRSVFSGTELLSEFPTCASTDLLPGGVPGTGALGPFLVG